MGCVEKKSPQDGRKEVQEVQDLGFLAPFIFFPDLGFFFGGEVVNDVKSFANFFGCLAFNHGCNGGAGEVEEGFDIHVVGSEDEFKEEFLVDVDVFRIPFLDDLMHVGGFEGLFNVGHGIFGVPAAEFDNFRKDVGFDIR